MKNFLLILFLLVNTLTYSQNDSIPDNSTDKNVSTAERVIDKYSGKAYDAVKELANALKVPAEHVYTVLVKQGIVEGVTWLVIFIIMSIMLGIAIKIMFTLPMFTDSDYDDNVTVPGIFAILGGIIGGIGVVICLFHIDVMVGGFINPEYYAIREIVEILK